MKGSERGIPSSPLVFSGERCGRNELASSRARVSLGAGENKSFGTSDGFSSDFGVAPVLNFERAGVDDWSVPEKSTSMSMSEVFTGSKAENVGTSGYMRSRLAPPGERGHTLPPSAPPGVWGTRSKDVLNGCNFGGENNESPGMLEATRRIVVVAGSWDILRRALSGAGRPARAFCPGTG